MRGALRILHVSLNNACRRINCELFADDCEGAVISSRFEPLGDIMYGEPCRKVTTYTKLFEKLHPKPIESHTKEYMGQFSACPVNERKRLRV